MPTKTWACHPASSKAAKHAARRKKRIEGKVGELFEHRYLFVRRRLSPSESATLRRISRGQPQLRTLRGLMEEVYRLFDRRCRTTTALAKLAHLRSRLQRFGRLRTILKKLFAPGLEKALVFLDEKLLGATSNAVEAREPSVPKDTEDGVPSADASVDRGASGAGPASRASDPRPSRAETTKTLHKAMAASYRGPVSLLQGRLIPVFWSNADPVGEFS